MRTIEDIIITEERKLEESNSPKIASDILYNLIFIKNRGSNYVNKYKDIKTFFNFYIASKEDANFGYDNFNFKKISSLIDLLTPIEKTAIINYFISKLTKEFPEENREWFIEKKHDYEVSSIFYKKQYSKYPKALFLLLGKNLTRIFIILIIFFLIVCLFLLPAFSEKFVTFNIQYESYSDIFLLNHILNTLSLFSGLDNNLKISPVNWIGLLLIIIGKISFFFLIVNFIYIKITDKMSLK